MKTNQAVEGLVAAVMLGLVTNAPAMPSKQEINKAQPLVAELMAPAMDDYKAKKKTAAEVADAAVAFAAEAKTEAAKFMLYRSSIPYYVRGEAYDKAAEALTLLKSNVKDVPAEVVVEIISKATVRANKEKAPRLFELYRQAKTQATAEKDVRELRKNPASPANRRKLAEALATAGNWSEALKEFASLRDDTAQMAKKEQDGSAKSAALGEFWWTYKPTYENAEDTFKIHSAYYYRKALAADEITGLKKNIVEQRIKEYVEMAEVVPVSASTTALNAGSINLKTGGDSPFTVKGNEATLTLRSGVKLEFVKCPSGWVNLVDDYERGALRKVRITRPFWIMKQGLKKSDVVGTPVKFVVSANEFIAANPEQLLTFCSQATEDARAHLPKGYVIRMPSLAEWEYAYHAGDEDPRSDPFGTLLGHHSCFCNHDGNSPVNKWGLHDFHIDEKVLDRIEQTSARVFDDKKKRRIAKLPASESNEDYFCWHENLDAAPPMVRCPGDGSLWMKSKGAKAGFSRLVIGPDLVSEWKAKHAKK